MPDPRTRARRWTPPSAARKPRVEATGWTSLSPRGVTAKPSLGVRGSPARSPRPRRTRSRVCTGDTARSQAESARRVFPPRAHPAARDAPGRALRRSTGLRQVSRSPSDDPEPFARATRSAVTPRASGNALALARRPRGVPFLSDLATNPRSTDRNSRIARILNGAARAGDTGDA